MANLPEDCMIMSIDIGGSDRDETYAAAVTVRGVVLLLLSGVHVGHWCFCCIEDFGCGDGKVWKVYTVVD